MRRIAQLLILAVIALCVIPIFLESKLEITAQHNFNHQTALIFEDFNNVNEFSKWIPWAPKDSSTQKEFFSPYRGKGAGYKWKSNKDSIEFTITKSTQNKLVEYAVEGMEFGKNSTMVFELEPADSTQTTINWTIHSEEIGYFSRYYNYFTKKELAEKMELGFKQLETILKSDVLTAEQAKALQPGEIKIEPFEGAKLMVVRNKTGLEQKEIDTATEESFGLIHSYLIDFVKLKPTDIGNSTTYLESTDVANQSSLFFCGYPITESAPLGEGMEWLTLPASKCLVYIHKGSYETLDGSIEKLKTYARKNKLNLDNSYWIEYLNEPENIKNKEDLLTKIYFVIK